MPYKTTMINQFKRERKQALGTRRCGWLQCAKLVPTTMRWCSEHRKLIRVQQAQEWKQKNGKKEKSIWRKSKKSMRLRMIELEKKIIESIQPALNKTSEILKQLNLTKEEVQEYMTGGRVKAKELKTEPGDFIQL